MNSNVFTAPTEAAVYQYLKASGYDEMVLDLRRENLLLKSENSRLAEHHSSMEQRIRGLNEEIVEYQRLVSQQRAENLSSNRRAADQIRQLRMLCDNLKRQNANLEGLVSDRFSEDGDELVPSCGLKKELQSMHTSALGHNYRSPARVPSDKVDTLDKRGPVSPSFKEAYESAVLLSPTFIMKELLGN